MSVADVIGNRRSWHVECGDALAVLRTLPAGCVHCCVTSPPYYGLRDYGAAGQVGLEATPAAYVARLAEVFEEVRRVLRDDGTLWLNVGDSYATRGGTSCREEGRAGFGDGGRQRNGQPAGHKHKDLLGVPWMLAFALRDAGWYLRQDIIWAKPAPMPESVEDRCTKAHEYIFLLSKRPRYYYDAEAVREKGTVAAGETAPFSDAAGGRDLAMGREPSGNEKPGSVWTYNGFRNLRSVWTLAPRPFAEAHFATFPPELPVRCVRAGTSERGVCPSCGGPWRRVVERAPNPSKAANVGEDLSGGAAVTANPQTSKGLHRNGGNAQGPPAVTLGWEPSCPCPPAEPVPAIVLDCFAGAGTTLMVARRLGRRALGVELNPDYCDMARRRVEQDAPLFNAAPGA